MLFVVLFVGFLIHVYSVGYMAHEDGFQRYFTYLNLFMGAMLLLMVWAATSWCCSWAGKVSASAPTC